MCMCTYKHTIHTQELTILYVCVCIYMQLHVYIHIHPYIYVHRIVTHTPHRYSQRVEDIDYVVFIGMAEKPESSFKNWSEPCQNRDKSIS